MTDTPPQPAPRTQGDLDAVLRDVGAAVRGGDMPRAIELARQGLDRGLEHPGLLSIRSLWLEQDGRYEEALADLERALELAPNDFATLNAKGLVLDRLQRPHDAVAAFAAAVAAEPRFAPAHHNLGWAREMVGDQEAARHAYEHAIALKPDYAEPLAHLARLSLSRGDANGARIHAEQALRIDPTYATARVALAEAELKEGEVASAEAQLRGVLSDSGVTPLDRSIASGLLGDALDAQGRYAEAFKAYSDGNLELKALYAPRFAGRGQTIPQMLTWLIAYLNATTLESWRPRAAAPDPDGPATHLFMVSVPRSGSTFLENALAADPNTMLFYRADALNEAIRDFMVDADDLDHLSRLGDAELEPYRRAYWRRVREVGIEPRGRLFVDRMAMNFLRAPVIARLFPQAKLLFCLRDPRDLVLSCFRSRFQPNSITYEFLTLPGATLVYDLMMRLMLLYRERMPLNLGVVRYEDVVRDPDVQLRSACGFLGIDVTEPMSAYAALKSAEFAQADPPGFFGEGIGIWRNYAEPLAPVLEALRTWAKAFGYPED
jgi:tetratricopeptide (TPR) repeat protein